MSGWRPSRRAQLAAVFILPTALFLLLAVGVHRHFRIDVPDRLGDAARADAIAALRGALAGEPRTPTDPALVALRLADGGPAVVTLWYAGQPLIRTEGRGPTAATAIGAAAEALSSHPSRPNLPGGTLEGARLAVELVVGRGPLLDRPDALALFALHPGLEGLGAALPDGRELLLGPDDLIRAGALGARRPVPSIPELTIGLDRKKAHAAFGKAAGVAPAAFAALGARLFRIRVDGFVEQPTGKRDRPPLALTRGVAPAPPLTRDALREAALAGGRYLVRHLSPAGRYVYEVNLATGRATNPKGKGPYSLPRHAGTTYFLAELFRHTGEEFLREPIERAFGHLVSLVEAGGCRGTTPEGRAYACVVDRGEKRAVLGSTALAVVALVEYRRATGSEQYDALARELTEWMLWLQRPDGSYAHVYEVASETPDWDTQLLYFTGEAALAMARMYEVHGDPRYLASTERALDHLVAWYDFFAGGFFFGEEHWTCIASAAAWPHLKHRRYLDFCLGYGEFLRRQQVMPGDLPDQEDLVGTYGFTPFVVPNNTPAGSRTEAMISTYELARAHGEDPEELRQQILRAVTYTLGQQVREETGHTVSLAVEGIGAVPSSPIDRTVRIDFVQHVCSAMIRAVPLVDG
jgi:hypothetical protein